MTKRKTQPTAQADENLEDMAGVLRGADVKTEKIPWAWSGMLVGSAINLIDGYKGVGKSSIMANLAAKLSEGKPLPGDKKKSRGGSCLWFGSEENFAAAIKPRFLANGGKPEKLYTVRTEPGEDSPGLQLPMQEERLKGICLRLGVVVMILDPYSALVDRMTDTRHEQQTRAYLESLRRVAECCRLTVIMTRHFRKGKSSSPLEQGLGSVAIVNVARSVLRADRDADDPGQCWLTPISCNYGARSGSLGYKLKECDGSVFSVLWGSWEDVSLDEITEGGELAHERDEGGDAKRLLVDALKGGPVEARILIEEGRRAGIGERTLRKVKAQLGIQSVRTSAGKGVVGVWKWKLRKTAE